MWGGLKVESHESVDQNMLLSYKVIKKHYLTLFSTAILQRGAYNWIYFFGFQVLDGPTTGRAYKQGGL